MLSMVKNGSKLIYSEKDGYLSQFAGNYELEVPFKSEKVSPDMKLTAKTFTYDVNGCWHPKPRENQKVSIMGDSH